jgi:hypothetical protein
MRRALVVSLAVSCLGWTGRAAGQQLTKTFDYKPKDSIQDVSMAVDDVKINQVVFRMPKEGEAPTRRSTSEMVVRVDNESQTPVAVGVAVVVLDESGNIVAAGSGATRMGWVAVGQRIPVSMRLPFVSRNFAKAKKFTITMEVEPKTGSAPSPEASGAP